ncbi:serpin A9 isoform X1 [Choloepus didactylus]|uniref:serpin A9 isoform X1 n=1 Tax=Choloepus didactylus TaxID=27675 RepID=UPI00189D3292|nr:serpin A9 isoform X1 [Choloepus didactylus]
MASSLYLVVLVVGLCAPIYCASLPSTPNRGTICPSPTKATPSSQVSSSNTDFAFRLFRRLVLKTPGQNVVFSPVSISSALAMLSLGARSATKAQLLQGLGLALAGTPESAVHGAFQQLVHSLSAPRGDLDLKVGSALFIRKELRLLAEFLDSVQRLYASRVFPADLSSPSAARKRVSAYVEKVTKGKVVDLVRHLDPLTAMVLVNHIFFKAKWEKPFDPAETNKSSSFLVDKSVTVQVPMMHQMEQLAFGLDSELNCSVLQMDYSGNALAFFILPGHGKMRQLEEALSARTLRKWSCSLQKRWVEVFIPKFSISASYDLEAILPEMGIQDAFDNNADFSGITKAQFLKVSKATRKAVLEVGELGSEAAAATETKLELRAKEGPAHTVIRFHEPFVLLIVDKVTQNILFVGKVANPTKS